MRLLAVAGRGSPRRPRRSPCSSTGRFARRPPRPGRPPSRRWHRCRLGGRRRRPLRVVAETTWLARQARRRAPRPAAPRRRHDARRCAATPGVVTIHDLQPLRLPRATSARSSGATCGRCCRRRCAAAVVVVTLDRVHRGRRRRAPRRRPRAHPCSCRPASTRSTPGDRRARDRRCATATASPTGRSSCTRRSPTPTRTTSTLVRAFAGLAAADDPEPMLVLTGGPGRRRGAPCRRRSTRSASADRVRAHRPRPAARPRRAVRRGHGAGVPVALRGLRHPRRSRRWPRLPGRSPPTRPRCPRWSATPACWSTPTTSTGWAAAMARACSTDDERRRELAARGEARAAPRSPGPRRPRRWPSAYRAALRASTRPAGRRAGPTR